MDAKRAKQFWVEREMESGASMDEVANIAGDMEWAFQLMEEYADATASERVASDLMNAADKGEQVAIEFYEQDEIHDFHEGIEIARCLRMAANYLLGNNSA